jgi:hypothetical protein
MAAERISCQYHARDKLFELGMYSFIVYGVYLSIYGTTALVNLGRFFTFLIYAQSIGLL